MEGGGYCSSFFHYFGPDAGFDFHVAETNLELALWPKTASASRVLGF